MPRGTLYKGRTSLSLGILSKGSSIVNNTICLTVTQPALVWWFAVEGESSVINPNTKTATETVTLSLPPLTLFHNIRMFCSDGPTLKNKIEGNLPTLDNNSTSHIHMPVKKMYTTDICDNQHHQQPTLNPQEVYCCTAH